MCGVSWNAAAEKPKFLLGLSEGSCVALMIAHKEVGVDKPLDGDAQLRTVAPALFLIT